MSTVVTIFRHILRFSALTADEHSFKSCEKTVCVVTKNLREFFVESFLWIFARFQIICCRIYNCSFTALMFLFIMYSATMPCFFNITHFDLFSSMKQFNSINIFNRIVRSHNFFIFSSFIWHVELIKML